MTAKELMEKYSMSAHPENGAFVEKHFEHEGDSRASSGSIYYYVAPNEHTAFHKIDCDEYWCFVCGSPLELCCIDENGNVSFSKLGIEDGCDPIKYFKSGEIFASKNISFNESFSTENSYNTEDSYAMQNEPALDGSFVICITVPRFTYEGFEMFSDDEILSKYPVVKPFLD